MEHENETEVKILEIEGEEAISIIQSLGGKYIFDGTIRTYDFKTSEDGKSFIRLRHLSPWCGDDEFSIIYKDGQPSDTVAKLAHESKIKDICNTDKDFNQWIDFFKMSLPMIHGSFKHRISFLLGPFRIDIDDYDDIPTFMEIEGPDYETIKDFAKTLIPWFGKEESYMKNWGTSELFAHYRGDDFKSE